MSTNLKQELTLRKLALASSLSEDSDKAVAANLRSAKKKQKQLLAALEPQLEELLRVQNARAALEYQAALRKQAQKQLALPKETFYILYPILPETLTQKSIVIPVNRLPKRRFPSPEKACIAAGLRTEQSVWMVRDCSGIEVNAEFVMFFSSKDRYGASYKGKCWFYASRAMEALFKPIRKPRVQEQFKYESLEYRRQMAEESYEDDDE